MYPRGIEEVPTLGVLTAIGWSTAVRARERPTHQTVELSVN